MGCIFGGGIEPPVSVVLPGNGLSSLTIRLKFGSGASEVGLAGWLAKFVFSKIISIRQ